MFLTEGEIALRDHEAANGRHEKNAKRLAK